MAPSTVCSFDDLANEILLCIFEYLTPIERYKAFFECNSHLRSLVKRWTQYSRKGLDADIVRFSTLHSWYKHLWFHNGGTRFYILPSRGQQRRNNLHARVLDHEQLHWCFFRDLTFIKDERIREICARYSIYLNPFFYHDERRSNRSELRLFYGGIIIMEHCQDEIEQWLYENYPQHAEMILEAYKKWTRFEHALVPIFDGEWSKAVRTIRTAAENVWNELKELDDINIFEV